MMNSSLGNSQIGNINAYAVALIKKYLVTY